MKVQSMLLHFQKILLMLKPIVWNMSLCLVSDLITDLNEPSKLWTNSLMWCFILFWKLRIKLAFIRRFIQRFTPPNQSIQRVLKAVDILIENSSKAHPNGKDIQEPENLLDHLRQSDCSHDLLRHELLNLLLAARDTTSSLLTSCLYELSAHESLWNQLRIESNQLSQSHLISIDQLRELKLLRAVINETLR